MTLRVCLNSRISRSQAWLFAQNSLLIGGLLAVGYAAFSVEARYVYQAYQNFVFHGELARNHVPARTSRQPLSLIGEIAIPRLDISAIVKEGVDDGTLELAVGHIPETALPGEAGNVGVAAHRDTLFRGLKDVQRNDEIIVTTLQAKYVYRVVSYKVVNPSEVSVLTPSTNEKLLTLVTCYPFYFVGHAPKRFVVRARQIASIPRTGNL